MSDPLGQINLLRELSSDLRRRWQAGEPKSVEDYLAEHPALAADEAAACELIYREYCLRAEAGRPANAADYVRRFPQWAPRLVEMFLQHASGSASHLEETQMLGAMKTAAPPEAVKPEETLARGAETLAADPEKSQTGSRDPTVVWSGIDALLQTDPTAKKLRRVGDYELLEEIARGGMGVVYKARQLKLNRIVALKMILAGQLASDELVRRFYSEAEAAANLDHPGIVPIYEVNQHEGQHYFSMGYVDGTSLAARARSRPLSGREAAELLKRICEAVHYAHQRGVIHRDLKPQNVLLTADGQPKVTDFGLAKTVQSDSGLTASGQILGTPSYMPPEQAAGKAEELTPRCDVYSLGAMLYFLLTGKPPFQAESVIETLKQVIDREPPAPRTLNRAINVDLETICLKCLQKDPRQRFDTAQELADELGRFLSGEPIRSRRVGLVQRSIRWCRRKPLATALGAAVLLLVVVIPATVLVGRQASRAREVAGLQARFEAGMDRKAFTADHLAEMETIVAALSVAAPEEAEGLQRRLHKHFVGNIRASINAPKLSAEDVAGLEQAIALLRKRDMAEADSLSSSLAGRVTAWQTEFDIKTPFANLDAVFPSDSVRVENGHLRSVAKGREVVTKAASAGNVQFEAVFHPTWQQAAELGLRLGESKAHYLFRIRVLPAASTQEDGEAPSASFEHARRAGGSCLIEILRGGQLVQRQMVPVEQLTEGPLRLWAKRSREELTLQVNELRPLVFLDPFPLPAELGAFVVVWPAESGLVSLRGLRQVQATVASALEQADQQFDAAKYNDALRLYQDPEINAPDSPHRQEALYKQAQCLLALQRLEQAADLLEPLMLEQGDRWPPLAGCRLWSLRLRQNRHEEADAIYQQLSSLFSFEQLAVLIPSEVRDSIVGSYLMEVRSLDRLLRFNPDRLQNIERAVAIDKLLSPDGRGTVEPSIALADVNEFLGDSDRAAVIMAELARTSRTGNVLRRYFRLLRMTRRSDLVLTEVDRAITVDFPQHKDTWTMLLVERARAHAALGNWDQAEHDVDRVLAIAAELKHAVDGNAHSDACLIKGVLLDRRGQAEAARAAWRDGYLQYASRIRQMGIANGATVNALICGSLCGELSEQTTADFLVAVQASRGSVFLAALQSALSQQSVHRTLLAMWQTPRGRKLAESLAWYDTGRAHRVRTPLVLTGYEYVRQNFFHGELSSDQDELCWEVSNLVFEGAFVTGSLSTGQMVQLGLTLKGTTNILGWAGVAPTLAPAMRGKLAYILAHRFLRSNKGEEANTMLAQAAKDAPADSVLARLCREDAELIQSQRGGLNLRNAADVPVMVKVLQGGREVQSLEVKDRDSIELAPGTYDLQLAEAGQDVRLSVARAKVSAGGRQEVVIESRWRDSPAAALPGLVARPAVREGLPRWQVLSKPMRGSRFAHAMSPDGTLSAITGSDGAMHLQDAATGELKHLLVGHGSIVLGMEFSPDGQWLASRANEPPVRVWNVTTGTPALALSIGAPRALAWSPDSQTLAISSYRRKVYLCDLKGTTFAAWDGDVSSLTFRPDGKSVVGLMGDRTLKSWRLDGQPGPAPPLAKRVQQLAFSPDGNWLATFSDDQKLRLWDAAQAAEQPAWEVQRSKTKLLRFAADSKSLGVATEDGLVCLHQVTDGAQQWVSTKTGHVFSLSQRPDGHWLAGDWSMSLREWDADGTAGPVKLWSRSLVPCLAFDLPRQSVVVTTSDKQTQLWSLDAQLQLDTKQVPAFTAAAVSPDGSLIGAVSGDKARLWDRNTAALQCMLNEHRGPVSPQAVAFSPDGQLVAMGGHEKRLAVWQIDGTLHWSTSELPDAVFCVAFSADGRHLLAGLGDADKGIHRLDAATGAIIGVMRGHEGGVRDVAASPDGRWVASCSHDRTVRLWDAEGNAGPVMRHASAFFHSVAWHPDSQSLVAGGSHGTCRMWQVDGTAGPVLTGNTAEVFHVSFNQDGTEIISSGDDGAIRCWDSASGQPRRTLALLANNQAVTFAPSGRQFTATEQADGELLYVVERPDRAFDVLTSADFHRRVSDHPSR